jgi:EpsI family protein
LLLTGGARRLATGASALRGPACVGAILFVLAVAYWSTVRELSGFGTRTDGQFLIVLGVFAGLVWGRRHVLEEIPVRPFSPALAALLALTFGWLMGEIAFVRLVTDLSVVLMIPVAILALCGVQWVAALAFPLAFLALAIPLEQPVAPVLAEWTARATILLLEAVGVPVERAGTYFTIPSGRWVVADACGGVKYLTSCVIVSMLLAPELFRSLRQRIAFVLGAVALAIVGNWIRAFLTVLGAHLTSNQMLRDDHSTFGWIVYAVLFALYCLAWWPVRDRNVGRSERAFTAMKTLPPSSVRRITVVAAAAFAVAVSGPVISSAMSAQQSDHPAPALEIPEAHGWVRTSHTATPWRPALQNVAHTALLSFRKDGRTVDLFIGLFQEERWEAKLVSVNNKFVGPDSAWALAGRNVARARFAGRDMTTNQVLIVGADRRVVAWQWYWVDGHATASGIEAKLAQVRSRLTSGRQRSAWISVSADAEADLQAFLAELGPVIERSLSGAFR